MNRSPKAMARQLDDELVILDVESGEYYGLNEVGRVVWDNLDGRSLEEITDIICAEFAVEPDRARTDVERLVIELRAAGLVVDESP